MQVVAETGVELFFILKVSASTLEEKHKKRLSTAATENPIWHGFELAEASPP
jgi:hypothetical protein